MTIKRGEDWGTTVERPPDAVEAASDADAARLVAAGRPVVLTGGDLRRTLGSAPAGPTVTRFPIDVLRVDADGTTHDAVAHVVLRRPGPLGWWRGELVAVMNAEFLGAWDVAPRSHPNDGVADVVTVAASMTIRQRGAARRRLPLGTHVPHPSISVARRAEWSATFERPVAVYVDGIRRGDATRVTVRVEPDAAVVHA